MAWHSLAVASYLFFSQLVCNFKVSSWTYIHHYTASGSRVVDVADDRFMFVHYTFSLV